MEIEIQPDAGGVPVPDNISTTTADNRPTDTEIVTPDLSQTAYVDKVLEDLGMANSHAVKIPMDPGCKLEPAPPEHNATSELRQLYQSAVGSLIYLMLCTRPDISFAVSSVSSYAANPTEVHWKAVKHILRYLSGTRNWVLVYQGMLTRLLGYTDSDWAGDIATRRSTAGYLFNIGSAAISWSSKRQPTVALSSCEAEYMGQTQAAKEAVWLRKLLNQINPTEDAQATIIFGDNQGAIALTKNDQFHARTKHVDIQHHYIRETVANATSSGRLL